MGRKIKSRHFMAGLAACGAALAMLSTPVGLIELVVTSTGLSESLPAAAPPLGLTARVLLAAFAAAMAAGAIFAFNRNERAETAEGDKIMGFALSRLTAFARGRGRSGNDLPVLRRADAHPDAPARRPIFASRDFRDVEIFKAATTSTPTASATVTPLFVEEARDPIIDGGGLAMPCAPEPLPDDEIMRLANPYFHRIAADEDFKATAPVPDSALDEPVVEAAVLTDIPPPQPEPESGASSIADLAARFERGLARRIALVEAAAATHRAEAALAGAAPSGEQRQPVLADIPPAPPVEVRADVDAEIGEALRAALGTLQRMTSRAG